MKNIDRLLIAQIATSTKHIDPSRDIMRICRAGHPKIVCLCGSTKFWRTFQEQSLSLSLAGVIVLSIGSATASDEEHGITPAQKEIFNELHKRKIDLCDEVLVLNVNGYIGDHTRSEIRYAESIRRPVKYLSPVILNGKDRFA